MDTDSFKTFTYIYIYQRLYGKLYMEKYIWWGKLCGTIYGVYINKHINDIWIYIYIYGGALRFPPQGPGETKIIRGQGKQQACQHEVHLLYCLVVIRNYSEVIEIEFCSRMDHILYHSWVTSALLPAPLLILVLILELVLFFRKLANAFLHFCGQIICTWVAVCFSFFFDC